MHHGHHGKKMKKHAYRHMSYDAMGCGICEDKMMKYKECCPEAMGDKSMMKERSECMKECDMARPDSIEVKK